VFGAFGVGFFQPLTSGIEHPFFADLPASFSFKKSKLGIRNSNLVCFPVFDFRFSSFGFTNFRLRFGSSVLNLSFLTSSL